MKPLIAQVCFSTAWGGLEMSSVKWAKRFQDYNYPSILVTTKDSKASHWAQQQKLRVFEMDEPRDYLSLRTRRELKYFLKSEQPAAIFNHLTRDLWHLSPVLKKFPHIKLFNYARMFIRDINKKDLLHRYIYSRLDKMIALSSIQKEFLLQCLPVANDKICVIPNAVDTESFLPNPPSQKVREEFGVTDDSQILIGLIGRLDELKGHSEFVEAAAQVHRAHPQSRFVFVGGNTAFEGESFASKIQKKVEQLGLKDVLRFTNHRNDMPEVYNALDVFCMPSYEENFGNVMLEALASGVPSIGTCSGGTPEMIENEKNGLLVKPKNSQDLAQALSQLVSSKNLRDQLAHAARETATSRFSIKTVFSQVEALLN